MLTHPRKPQTAKETWEKKQLCENLKDALQKIDYLSLIQQKYRLTEEERNVMSEMLGDYISKAFKVVSELENMLKGENKNV